MSGFSDSRAKAYYPNLPIRLRAGILSGSWANSGTSGVRSRLQRRDRSGLSPDSPVPNNAKTDSPVKMSM